MYEELLAKFEREIAGLEKTREFVKELPELALPDTAYWMTANHDHIGINLPYSYELINRNKKIMEDAGFKEYTSYQFTDDGVLHKGYRKDNQKNSVVDFFYRPNLAGSTCKLNLLGYEQKPVYEVTCMDAEPLTA